jgi:hypothetical protein
MPLGKASLEKLDTCHHDLSALIIRVARGVDQGDLAYAGIHDITVTCGYRGKEEQNAAYNARPQRSKTPWPRSAHNRQPSDAVDIAPFPIDWSDTRAFEILHAYVAGVAHAMGIDLFDISWDRPHIQRRTP